MTASPKLTHIEQVSTGWVNKYILTYEMPDGRVHNYECASRKPLDKFEAGLGVRGIASRAAMEALGGSAEDAKAPRGNIAGSKENPDAVCIVARTPQDTLVMIREFRYPLNSWCIAFPAGLVDPGEDIIECACRELEEETGFRVVNPQRARALPQAGFSSTGLTDETVQIVFVEAQRAGDARTEPNELIEVFELPVAQVAAFLESNPLPIGTRAQLVLQAYVQNA